VNNWTRKRKARGFTLVELLIVIVIIGILAGSMLLVFGSATDKAKATKVVSNLRSLKAAALMYYVDTGDWPTGDITVLDKYMDRDIGPDDVAAEYGVEQVSGDTKYVLYAVVSGDSAGNIKKKLEEMASDSGLVKRSDLQPYEENDDPALILSK